MSEISRNFAYDPFRQGVDTNSWRILAGSPAIDAKGRIVVYTGSGASTIMFHYADIIKGEVSFNINVPNAPTAGDSRMFGLSTPDQSEYIRFRITDVFKCHTLKNNVRTASDDLDWSSDWTGENINFKIVWEAGMVKFFVNDRNIYTVSDSSIPYGPLSLYLVDKSTSSMTVGHIAVNNAESIFVNPVTSDTTSINVDSLSTSPSISSSISSSASPSISPSASPSLSPSVSISPSISPSISSSLSPSISPSISSSLSSSISSSVSPSVSPSVSLSPSISSSLSSSISSSISSSTSPSTSISSSISPSPSA